MTAITISNHKGHGGAVKIFSQRMTEVFVEQPLASLGSVKDNKLLESTAFLTLPVLLYEIIVPPPGLCHPPPPGQKAPEALPPPP